MLAQSPSSWASRSSSLRAKSADFELPRVGLPAEDVDAEAGVERGAREREPRVEVALRDQALALLVERGRDPRGQVARGIQSARARQQAERRARVALVGRLARPLEQHGERVGASEERGVVGVDLAQERDRQRTSREGDPDELAPGRGVVRPRDEARRLLGLGRPLQGAREREAARQLESGPHLGRVRGLEGGRLDRLETVEGRLTLTRDRLGSHPREGDLEGEATGRAPGRDVGETIGAERLVSREVGEQLEERALRVALGQALSRSPRAARVASRQPLLRATDRARPAELAPRRVARARRARVLDEGLGVLERRAREDRRGRGSREPETHAPEGQPLVLERRPPRDGVRAPRGPPPGADGHEREEQERDRARDDHGEGEPHPGRQDAGRAPPLAPAHAREVGRHLAGGGVPLERVLLESLEDDAVDVDRELGSQGPRRDRLLAHDLGQHLDGALTLEGRLARQQLVEDRAEGEDVGALVEIAQPHGLLGRHVVRAADHVARPRQALVVGAPRDPEVDEHRLAVRLADQDVGGLDVAVDDPVLVHVRERERDLLGELERAGDGQLAAPGELVEGLADDQLGDAVGVASILAGALDREDVGVRGELGESLDLAPEALAELVVLRRAEEGDLDRASHAAVVDSHEHGAHAAAADDALEAVLGKALAGARRRLGGRVRPAPALHGVGSVGAGTLEPRLDAGDGREIRRRRSGLLVGRAEGRLPRPLERGVRRLGHAPGPWVGLGVDLVLGQPLARGRFHIAFRIRAR